MGLKDAYGSVCQATALESGAIMVKKRLRPYPPTLPEIEP
jgi:hypothetical protein